MSLEPQRALARRFFAEQDRLRGGPAPDLCAPRYAAHIGSYPTFDMAGHQAFAGAFYASFPDLRHEVDLVIAEGDRVAVRFRLFGTHTEPFFGIAPTGRSICVGAIACMAIVGGQVAELWGEFDQAGLMQQLTAEAALAGSAGGI